MDVTDEFDKTIAFSVYTALEHTFYRCRGVHLYEIWRKEGAEEVYAWRSKRKSVIGVEFPFA